MPGNIKNYRDLIAWQKAVHFADVVYSASEIFPKHELYGLGAQIRRSAVSVSANLAEGSTRGRKEFIHFFNISRGSLAETETHMIIAQRRNYITENQLHDVLDKADELSRILMGLLKSLKAAT